MGRTVIATNVAGHSEVIEDGTSGFLADALELIPPDPTEVFSEKSRDLKNHR
jgi:hypothetical protein